MHDIHPDPLPAPASGLPCYLVGQDEHGWWLALETHHRGGGLFKSREDAIHFVESETGHRCEALAVSAAALTLRF